MAAATISVILRKETGRRLYRQLSMGNRTLTHETATELQSALAQYFAQPEPIPESRPSEEEP